VGDPLREAGRDDDEVVSFSMDPDLYESVLSCCYWL